MRKRNICFKIGIVFLIFGLLMTVSCSKQKPKYDPMETFPTDAETMTQSDASTDAGVISEEELAAQRMREQEAAQRLSEQEEIRNREAAQKFTAADIYFNYDDATLTSDARQVLKEKIVWLRTNMAVSVVIEGHCDERGTEEYNIALGQRRAQSIKTFLVNSGINGAQLKTISYGEERPVVFGNNERAWAKNRRGHFRLDK